MGTQVLYLPHYTPVSLNASVGRHWSVKAKQKKADRELFAYYAREQKLMPPEGLIPWGKRRVHFRIVLAKGQRAIDPDNLYKAALDSLHFCRLIVNDSPAWLELGTVEFVRHAGTLREVFIILEDLEARIVPRATTFQPPEPDTNTWQQPEE